MVKLARLLAALLAFTLIAAACGDDSGTTADDTAADDTAADDTAADDTAADDTMADDTMADDTMADDTMADDTMADDTGTDGLAVARARVEELRVIPTEIGVTEPLTGVPEPKTFAWLQCELPSCAQIGVGVEAATDLLGWEALVIDVPSFDPAPGFQTAIDSGADFVALSGTPAALVQDQIDAAAAAGIPFLSCFSADEPGGEANNIWMQCGDAPNVYNAGTNIANWIIADSGGTANVLMVNIRDFPVLVAEEEGSADTYAANCPDCTFDVLNVTIDQFAGGEVPGAVASQLQSNEDIDYVHFSFADIPAGVADTLEESGLLDRVKLVGVDYNAADLQEIVDGRHQAWTTNPKEYAGVLMVDHAARLSLGMELTEERAASDLPTFIVDDPALAESLIPTDGWIGPDGMYDQFSELWGVG